MEIESRANWNARADTGELYLIPLVVMADRCAGHRGPSAAYKPFGDVLRLPVASDWLVTLRDRVLGGKSVVKSKRPVLFYLERQDSGRRLLEEDHDKLVEAFQRLADEGLVDFEVIRFTKEQVGTIARADVGYSH